MTLQPLAYDTPRHATPTVWLHYVALACGLLPLAVGTLIFLLFLVFRAYLLAALGFFTILAGVCLAVAGVVCAGVYLSQARRAAPDEAARARRRAFVDIGIIFANFPIAFGMAWLGIWLMSRVTIAVHNADAVPVEQLRLVTEYGGTHDLGTVAPGATRSVTLNDEDFIDLVFTYVHGGVEQRQTVSDWWYDDEVPGGGLIRVSINNGEVKLDAANQSDAGIE